MTNLRFHGVSFDALDPERLADFWGHVLGWPVGADRFGNPTVGPGADQVIAFHRTDVPKASQNRIHFDLPSATAEAMRATIDRALARGGRLINIGQTPEDKHEVLADPEDNEFCVIEPGNQFLAGTGVIGAINCDGTRALGHFWSKALDWPLVWDQDDETAIQSPGGGSKITWSGPPLMPRVGRDRLRLDVAVPDANDADAEVARLRLDVAVPDANDADAEVARLESLGAWRADEGSVVGGVTMIDPDGNEFRVLFGG